MVIIGFVLCGTAGLIAGLTAEDSNQFICILGAVIMSQIGMALILSN